MKLFYIKVICVLICFSLLGCTSSKKIQTIELTGKFRSSIKHVSVSEDIVFIGNDYEVTLVKYTIMGCCVAGPFGCLIGCCFDIPKSKKYTNELKKVILIKIFSF